MAPWLRTRSLTTFLSNKYYRFGLAVELTRHEPHREQVAANSDTQYNLENGNVYIESMSQRVETMEAAKGGIIKYKV